MRIQNRNISGKYRPSIGKACHLLYVYIVLIVDN